MIILVTKSRAEEKWWFHIAGKNGKTIATSCSYINKKSLMRCIQKIANTVSWKIRDLT